jgi:hypothetical protein
MINRSRCLSLCDDVLWSTVSASAAVCTVTTRDSRPSTVPFQQYANISRALQRFVTATSDTAYVHLLRCVVVFILLIIIFYFVSV